MKILWTCAIFCVLLGVSSAQNVVQNLSYRNHSVSTYKTSGSSGQSAGQGAAYTTSGLGGQVSGQGIISGQLCPGSSGCTTSIVPPHQSCSAGFVLSGNMCVRSEVKIRTGEMISRCPYGYSMSNGMCARQNSASTQVPLQHVCPAGFTLQGNLCYPATTIPVQPPIVHPPPVITQPPPQPPPVVQPTQCPSGYSFNGVNCAQYTPNCPTGYQYSGGLCHTSNPPCAYPTNLNCGMVQQQSSCCGTSVVAPTFPQVSIPQPPPPVPPYYPPVPPVTPPPIPPMQPVPATPQCPPDHEMMGNACFAKIMTEDIKPPIMSCPDGFIQNGENCIKQEVVVAQENPIIVCPEGTTRTANGCIREICVNANTVQNCTSYIPAPSSAPGGFNHLSNYINNHNPVNVTTNVNANSSTYVRIHLASEDSETRVETDSQGPVEIITSAPRQAPIIRPPVPPKTDKCCTVVSPRMCKTMQSGTWGCFHRRKQVCSSMCERSQMYLRPRQPIYRPPVMVIPPMRTRSCHSCGYQAQHDCSGCYSRGYCPQYCSSYDCSAGECGYMSQESYCQEHGGEFCSQEYGCLEGDYCEE